MPRHRYQIHLDPQEHEILRRLAFERRTTISVLVRLAIGLWIAGERKKGPTARLVRRIAAEAREKAKGKRPARTGRPR